MGGTACLASLFYIDTGENRNFRADKREPARVAAL
jgi:hypothetical protein